MLTKIKNIRIFYLSMQVVVSHIHIKQKNIYALFTSGGVFKYSSALLWFISARAVPESIGKSDFRRIIGLSLLITLFRSIFTYGKSCKIESFLNFFF